ncbi:MAG: hypothetical protein ABIE36_01345 [Candidatus Diapherotrites archaeon]
MKKALVSLILLVLLALLVFFLFCDISDKTTGKITDNYDRSWTKAICNETHCQDYEIVCNRETVISQISITGALIEISEKWEDPRNESMKNEVCD